MKRLYVILSFVCLFSCQSKEDKLVQAEFAKVLGKWTIDKVILSANAPAELQNKIKTGEIFFEDGCRYDAKKFAKSNQGCGADIEINGKVFSFGYTYLYSKQQYKWGLGVYENADTSTRDIYRYASQIFDGNWEVVVSGNTLTAQRKGVEFSYQIPAGVFYEGDVTFIATRK